MELFGALGEGGGAAVPTKGGLFQDAKVKELFSEPYLVLQAIPDLVDVICWLKKHNTHCYNINCNTSKFKVWDFFSSLLKEQQSSSIPWQSGLPAEAYFPPSCHPPQTYTSSSWGSDLWPRHREADTQGPSGVTATTLPPRVRVFVALWSQRAVLSQVRTESEQCNSIYWGIDAMI